MTSIAIKISQDGELSIQVLGSAELEADGVSCNQWSSELEQALGVVTEVEQTYVPPERDHHVMIDDRLTN